MIELLPIPYRPALTTLATALVAAMLTACGGGGSDGSVEPEQSSDAAYGHPTMTALSAASPQGSATSAAAKSSTSPAATRIIRPAATGQAPGTGVFVDAVNGNDANAGTFAAPWKTLAKVASSARLKTGDGIWLSCGSTWRESLSLGTTQLVDQSFITGYGSACSTTKPKISGADSFAGSWTKSGNIWARKVPISEPKILRLFINGVSQRTAQWPNYGGVGHEYAIADPASPSSTTSLKVGTADAASLSGKNLVGATLMVRSDPWHVDTDVVASYNASSRTLTTTKASTYAMEGGDGYVLQNQLWMLDAPGEFYHDTVNGVLYVYPADAASQTNLNASAVEGSVRDTALTVATRTGVAVSNIVVTMARTDGLFLNQAPAASATGIEASHNGSTGIHVTLASAPTNGTRGATVKGNTISDNWMIGIDTGAAINVDILSNTVSDTGTIGDAGNTSAGILAGDGANVDRNSVTGTGYHGIQFSGTGGTKITNNTVQSYCLRLTDCAGIYAWNASTPAAQRTVNQLSTVANNRILAASANLQGSVGGGFDLVSGIYLDNFMTNVTVQANMLNGMPIGILLHNSSHNVISENNVWFTTSTGLWANMDQTTGDYMTNNTFQGNQFAPATTVSGTWPALPQLGSSYAISFQNKVSGTASMTSGSNAFTQNQYVQLNGVASAIASVITASGQQLLTFSGWQALNPSEMPLWAPATYAAYSTTEGPELVAGGAFNSGISPWSSWFWSGASGGSVQAVSNVNGCSGTCAQFRAASIYDLFFSPGFSMIPNVPHVLRFNATFGSAGTIARPGIGTNTNPSTSILGSQGYVTLNSLTGSAGDVINFQGIFVPNSGASARVNLGMNTPGTSVSFDSISVKEVTGYTWSKASDWSAVVYAPIDNSKSVSCSDLGWGSSCMVMDVNGHSVPMPISLPAGSESLLLRLDTPWKTQ